MSRARPKQPGIKCRDFETAHMYRVSPVTELVYIYVTSPGTAQPSNFSYRQMFGSE